MCKNLQLALPECLPGLRRDIYPSDQGDMNGLNQSRPALKLVHGAQQEAPVEWVWFCGHCAARSADGAVPAPVAAQPAYPSLSSAKFDRRPLRIG